MVKLVNDPHAFRDQFYEGFLRAYAGRVAPVAGSYV
jgi:hypothetical protein